MCWLFPWPPRSGEPRLRPTEFSDPDKKRRLPGYRSFIKNSNSPVHEIANEIVRTEESFRLRKNGNCEFAGEEKLLGGFVRTFFFSLVIFTSSCRLKSVFVSSFFRLMFAKGCLFVRETFFFLFIRKFCNSKNFEVSTMYTLSGCKFVNYVPNFASN